MTSCVKFSQSHTISSSSSPRPARMILFTRTRPTILAQREALAQTVLSSSVQTSPSPAPPMESIGGTENEGEAPRRSAIAKSFFHTVGNFTAGKYFNAKLVHGFLNSIRSSQVRYDLPGTPTVLISRIFKNAGWFSSEHRFSPDCPPPRLGRSASGPLFWQYLLSCLYH